MMKWFGKSKKEEKTFQQQCYCTVMFCTLFSGIFLVCWALSQAGPVRALKFDQEIPLELNDQMTELLAKLEAAQKEREEKGAAVVEEPTGVEVIGARLAVKLMRHLRASSDPTANIGFSPAGVAQSLLNVVARLPPAAATRAAQSLGLTDDVTQVAEEHRAALEVAETRNSASDLVIETRLFCSNPATSSLCDASDEDDHETITSREDLTNWLSDYDSSVQDDVTLLDDVTSSAFSAVAVAPYWDKKFLSANTNTGEFSTVRDATAQSVEMMAQTNSFMWAVSEGHDVEILVLFTAKQMSELYIFMLPNDVEKQDAFFGSSFEVLYMCCR